MDNYVSLGGQIKSCLYWLEVANKALKEFFQALQAYHTNFRIIKIKQSTSILSSLPNILEAFVHHYKNVFSL